MHKTVRRMDVKLFPDESYGDSSRQLSYVLARQQSFIAAPSRA